MVRNLPPPIFKVLYLWGRWPIKPQEPIRWKGVHQSCPPLTGKIKMKNNED